MSSLFENNPNGQFNLNPDQTPAAPMPAEPTSQSTSNNQTGSILSQEEANLEAQPSTKKKLSLFSVLLLLLIFVATGLGIYLQLSINSLNQDITTTQTAIQAQAQNVISSDNQEVGLQVKKAFLDLKSTERTFFKNVVQDINQDIISNSNFRAQSFTVNGQGQISINLVSTTESINPIQDTSNLIETLKQRSYFSNTFVPGITQSLNENGLAQIQFNLQLSHSLENQSSTQNQPQTSTPETPTTDNTETETPSTSERPVLITE